MLFIDLAASIKPRYPLALSETVVGLVFFFPVKKIKYEINHFYDWLTELDK